MSQLQSQLEGLPGYDIVMDAFNTYAGDRLNTKDPFQDNTGKRRKLTSTFHSDKERKGWRRIQREAWVHDKCFLGLCGVGLNFGLGLVPLAVLLLPAIGPIAMYAVHARLINIAREEVRLPPKLIGKLQTNILIDLLISFPPLIGAFFSWLNGCLTRNASAVYSYMEFIGERRENGLETEYIGTRDHPIEPVYGARIGTQQPQKDKRGIFGRTTDTPQREILVGQQQSGVRQAFSE